MKEGLAQPAPYFRLPLLFSLNDNIAGYETIRYTMNRDLD